MRLAAHLSMTYGELCQRMGSVEVSMWLAKERFDPIPDPWAMFGTLAALLANPYRGRRRAYTAEDFMPGRRQRRRQTPEEMMAVFDGMARRMGRRSQGRT